MITPIVLLSLSACQSPLTSGPAVSLQQRVITDAQQWADRQPDFYTSFATSAPPQSYAQHHPTDDLDARPASLALPDELDFGNGLDDVPSAIVSLSLDQAVSHTLNHNINNQIARLTPRLANAQVTIEEAEFDWTAFANGQFGETDLPQAATALSGVPIGVERTESTDASVSAGIRKRIQYGGTIEFSTGFDYANDKSVGLELAPDPNWLSNFSFTLTQPLLRDAGTYVTRARIQVAQNASQREMLEVQNQISQSVAETEAAYWQLFSAYHQLAIQQELLDETRRTFDRLQNRGDVDVNPVQLAQAEREVHQREATVWQARQALRTSSDQLKLLMNNPDMPLLEEDLIQPIDYPQELPVAFDLKQSVTTAITHRSEMQQIQLEIEDARIQQNVSENQLQPRLDVVTRIRHFGIDDTISQSAGDFADNDTLDYSVGLAYEQSLENRAAEAGYLRSRLGSQVQELRYRQAAHELSLSVKSSIRNVVTNYRIWQIAQQERRAAHNHLAAINEREDLDQAGSQTASFLLDLKLRAQQRLAEAESREIVALTNYNIAIIRYHQTLGTLLIERNIVVDRYARAATTTPSQEETQP